MNDIQIFNNPEFGQIRMVLIDNEPWFVAKDISEKLGYSKTYSMTKQVDDEDKVIFDTSSQEDAKYFNSKTRSIMVINESGLYSAIIGSTLISAKKFKRWVTKDVLPSIRKTGFYQAPMTTDSKIALLAQGHTELKAEVEEIKSDIEELKQELPILPLEADIISKEAKQKGAEVLGGKGSNAYKNKSLRQNVFTSIYGNLKYNFGITGTYKKLKRSQCEKAVEIIRAYQPPLYLKEKIDKENNK